MRIHLRNYFAKPFKFINAAYKNLENTIHDTYVSYKLDVSWE